MISLSLERLHHFRCGACKQWWSIGDWSATGRSLYCPACGRQQHVLPADSLPATMVNGAAQPTRVATVTDRLLNLFGQLIQEIARRLFPAGSALEVGPLETDTAMPLTVRMKVGQRCRLKANIRDDRGQPAQVEPSSATWAVQFGAVEVRPEPDGVSCTVRAIPGSEGTSHVVFTGDADLGEGKRLILDVAEVVVSPREASSVSLESDTPEDDPEGAPSTATTTTPAPTA